MMNEFWKTVLSSVGFSVGACAFLGWLFREWISARIKESIKHEYNKKYVDYKTKVQHEYDKKFADYETKVQHEYEKKFSDYETKVQHEYNLKLEDFKSRIHFEYELRLESSKKDFQKLLDEHQTRFKYWHEEKSKAIKEFYYSVVLLYQEMRDFRAISKRFANNVGIHKILDEKIEHIRQLDDSAYKEWICLRLFLKNEELLIANSFFPKNHSVFQAFVNQYERNNYTLAGERIDQDLEDLIKIVEDLREKLQAILKVQDDIFTDKGKNEQNKSSISAEPAQSLRNGEVK